MASFVGHRGWLREGEAFGIFYAFFTAQLANWAQPKDSPYVHAILTFSSHPLWDMIAAFLLNYLGLEGC